MKSAKKARPFGETALQVIRWLSQAGMAVSSVTLFILMFYMGADICARYFFNYPLPGTLEISRLMLVAIVFPAIAFTQAKGMNINVEFIVNRWSFRKRAILNVLYCVMAIVIFGLMTKQGLTYALSDLQYGVATDVLKVPLFPAKLLIPIGAFLMILQIFLDLTRSIQQVVKGR